ncbi:hypothetical protein PRZ48_008574 [Zasmidium cellare]|uniref:Uncharacterized protein n=1 Tax=Zasmidium cellare TaxID=395010 RepID=A0ABR0EGX1_ZASCE|nr:hypothetical protein PRZ48_008574 [Zasmidium cellare]
MAGPHTSGTASFQTNPLLPTYASLRRFKPRGKKLRPRLPTNFAPEPAQASGSPGVEVLKVVSVNRQPPRPKGKEVVKPAVKPAVKPPATISTTPAKYHTLPLLPKVQTPAQDVERADVIDLTSESDSPKLAPMKPAAPNTSSRATPLPPINPPTRTNIPNITTFQQETWSLAPSGRIQLPEPRQSHSAGYHPRHQGPRYKVLPAGFGGLELARGLRGKDCKSRQGDEKVRKEMAYTLKRHVEEYWR